MAYTTMFVFHNQCYLKMMQYICVYMWPFKMMYIFIHSGHSNSIIIYYQFFTWYVLVLNFACIYILLDVFWRTMHIGNVLLTFFSESSNGWLGRSSFFTLENLRSHKNQIFRIQIRIKKHVQVYKGRTHPLRRESWTP